MLLNIEKLRRNPRQIAICEQAANFPVLKALEEDGSIVFQREISGELRATRAGDVIEVTGRLQTAIVVPCSRCLNDVASDLSVDVSLCYSNAGEDHSVNVEELEVGSDELGLINFVGDEIDLQPDVEQELLMALPQQALCRDDCLGLCPVCGCDRNQVKCSCEPPIFHAQLARLKGLKLDK